MTGQTDRPHRTPVGFSLPALTGGGCFCNLLPFQTPMFAVIKTGGKQYLVQEGELLKVEKLDANVGDKVDFEMLLKADGEKVDVGTPTLSAKVSAEVVEQGRNAKIEVVKYKAKSRYTRRVGHRQHFTKVKITKIA